MTRTLRSNPSLIGVSSDTYRYFLNKKDSFGKVVKVDMVDYDRGPRKYPMVLVTDTGDKMYLGGVASGYFGEGSRTAVEIIKLLGPEFESIDPAIVFKNTEFTLELVDGKVEVTRIA